MLENFRHFGEVLKVQKLFTSTLLSKFGSNGDTYFLQSWPSKLKIWKGKILKSWKPSGEKNWLSYPEVTPDNFNFRAGGRLVARWAVFWPLGRILAIIGDTHFTYILYPYIYLKYP